jgi:hypothetical protein
LLLNFEILQNLGGAGRSQVDEGDESWDEDEDASSYRDDDSSSDDGEGEEMRAIRPVPPQPQVHSNPVPSTSAGSKHSKELEWDHSSM